MNIIAWREFVVSQLSQEQRAQLAHELWESLDEPPGILSEEARRAELRNRIKAADAGDMPRHPWHEVEARLLNRNA